MKVYKQSGLIIFNQVDVFESIPLNGVTVNWNVDGQIFIRGLDTTLYKSFHYTVLQDANSNTFASLMEAIAYLLGNVVTTSSLVNIPYLEDFRIDSFTNGVTDNMNVDGSVTPQEFVFSNTKNTAITRIAIYLEGVGNFSSSTFADLPPLENGCILQVGGNTIFTVKDNVDFTILNDKENTDLLSNTRRNFSGAFDFTASQVLKANQQMKIIIQDDLSSLVRFTADVAYKEL